VPALSEVLLALKRDRSRYGWFELPGSGALTRHDGEVADVTPHQFTIELPPANLLLGAIDPTCSLSTVTVGSSSRSCRCVLC
jgi:hypothetical protein